MMRAREDYDSLVSDILGAIANDVPDDRFMDFLGSVAAFVGHEASTIDKGHQCGERIEELSLTMRKVAAINLERL